MLYFKGNGSAGRVVVRIVMNYLTFISVPINWLNVDRRRPRLEPRSPPTALHFVLFHNLNNWNTCEPKYVTIDMKGNIKLYLGSVLMILSILPKQCDTKFPMVTIHCVINRITSQRRRPPYSVLTKPSAKRSQLGRIVEIQ